MKKIYLRCLDLLSHIAGLINPDLTVSAPLRRRAGLTWQAVSSIVPTDYGDAVVLGRTSIAIFDFCVEGRRANH